MQEKLIEIIYNLCEEDIVREDLDIDLFEEGLLDSLAMTELLIAIEDEFGITLSPTEYDKTQLATVHKIEQVLKQRGASE